MKSFAAFAAVMLVAPAFAGLESGPKVGSDVAPFEVKDVTGKFKGKLMGTNNLPVHIDGLWAIAFGNDANAGPATTLFFAAGPDDETNGLFGTLTAVENVQGSHQ